MLVGDISPSFVAASCFGNMIWLKLMNGISGNPRYTYDKLLDI